MHFMVHTFGRCRCFPNAVKFVIIASALISAKSVEAQRVHKSADNEQGGIINSVLVPNHFSNRISTPEEQSFQWNVSSNGKNNGIKLCGSGSRRPIRVPVYTFSNVTTIPCWSPSPKFNPVHLSLFKGSLETGYWEDISEKVVGYYPDTGILYNVSGDAPVDSNSTYIGTYACRMDNSDNYVISQLYLDDYFVNVTVSPTSESCDSEYFTNHRKHTFWCQVRQDVYENAFQWFFQTVGGEEQVLNDSFGNRASYKYDDVFIGQNITFKFPSSDVTGIGCRVRRKNIPPRNSSPQTSDEIISLLVKDATKPFIHDANIIESYTDKPGIRLTCKYEVEPPMFPEWYQDGVKMTNGHFRMYTANRVKTSTIYQLDPTHDKTNYTCVLKNDRGAVSKTFLISRKAPDIQHSITLPTKT